VWYSEKSCSIDDFLQVVSRTTDPSSVAHAAAIEKNVPVYEGPALRENLDDIARKRAVMGELNSVLLDGPGVYVLKNAFPDTTPIDQATGVFNQIMEEERGQGGGDHFAKAGANDRIWNTLEKLCLKAPAVFARYYASDMIALAAEAWLGPAYQITSQINVVCPGGEAQQAHRDYHLGFQDREQAGRYPDHVHRLSPLLTLQGAIAHCDMPVESGPTKLLPFSQIYPAGYLAWRRSDFREFFEENHIQLPLEKGDAVFFNPALFHAAGANRSADTARMANLLQISSAFGRAMESVNRSQMCAALYPVLLAARQIGEMTMAETAYAVASCAEGYSFPTNLDRDPPLGEMAPKTQQTLMLEALNENKTAGQFAQALEELKYRQTPDNATWPE
jgi:ectoine hydroxylase-related dioxygenase (phytanoyl-CoA dioxygenase family)